MSDDARDRAAALAAIGPLLRAHYIFPERVDSVLEALDSLGAEADPAPAAWVARVTAVLQQSSGDLHLRLHHSDAVLERVDPFTEPAPTAGELVAERVRSRHESQGVQSVERLDGNVGLLRMREFVDPAFSGAHLVAAMTLLSGTDALIVDLRRSRGGAPAAVQLLCSWLFSEFAEPAHLNDIIEGTGTLVQFRTIPWLPVPRYLDRPVFVLTSARTFSAAEEFAYDLQQLGRATIVGVRTRGGAHPSTRVPLTDHYSLNLPSARSVNPVSGTNWEGTGVEPDVPTTEDDALTVAHRTALEQLEHSSADPAEVRATLRSLDRNPVVGRDG